MKEQLLITECSDNCIPIPLIKLLNLVASGAGTLTMQIHMDILIKMRGDIFTMCFLIQCSDFNYAIQEKKKGKRTNYCFHL